ncbi:MAG TPA: hypothetical protein VFP87_11880 [Chitinophagaceae bacterium]|nr:hypothetical protein [Chitinophagaceae bacterium]
MRNKFQELETSTLVQMLGQYTSQLTSILVKTVNTKEYDDCKRLIEELQVEIASRKSSPNSTTITPPDMSFET